jgi:ketosteroid isomerase-like protein
MSQGSVDVVREAMDLMGRVSSASGDEIEPRLLELFAPDVQIDMSRRIFNPDVYQGHAGLRRLGREVQEVWDEFSITPERFVETGERVAVIETRRGRGRESGVEVEQRAAVIWTVRGGRVVHMETDLEPRQALEALGLEEQGLSQENVEVVRDSLRAFADEGLDALAEFWHPDINWRAIEGALDDVGEMRGTAAVRRYAQDWLDTFEDITNVAEELLAVGDDRVVAVQHLTGRARLSGVETELRYAVLYTLRERKIIRVREYSDRDQALKAAALAG